MQVKTRQDNSQAQTTKNYWTTFKWKKKGITSFDKRLISENFVWSHQRNHQWRLEFVFKTELVIILCGISYTTLMMSFLQTGPNYQSNIHVGDKDGKAEK